MNINFDLKIKIEGVGMFEPQVTQNIAQGMPLTAHFVRSRYLIRFRRYGAPKRSARVAREPWMAWPTFPPGSTRTCLVIVKNRWLNVWRWPAHARRARGRLVMRASERGRARDKDSDRRGAKITVSLRRRYLRNRKSHRVRKKSILKRRLPRFCSYQF